MITLREYQEPFVNQCLYFFRSTKIEKPRIAVAPTAAGKSIMIAAVASKLPGKVLVIQPTIELLNQNYEKYCLYSDNGRIYSTGAKKWDIGKVTYATLGTIISVPELFLEFDALIIDECDRYPNSIKGNGEQSMFGKFIEKNPQLKILGLTATAFRLRSSRSSSKLIMMHNSHIYRNFQHIIQIQEIAPKYWSPLKYISEYGDLSLLKPNTTGAEYDAKSMVKYSESMSGQIKEALSENQNKKGLIFVPTIKEAERYAKMFKGSACVSSKTPAKERAQTLKDFKLGYIRRVVNVGILGVGYDHPEMEYLIDCNPTMSLGNYYQKLGRGTRQCEGKQFFTVYDFAGGHKKFGRIEDLEYRKMGTTYHIFGSGNKQLTGVNMIEDEDEAFDANAKFYDMKLNFGKKFPDKKISETPLWYLSWMADNVTNGDFLLMKNIKTFLARPELHKK